MIQLQFHWYEALLSHAALLDFIRERDPKHPNSGEGVQACQKMTGNEPPASWCCSFACKCAHCLFRTQWPLPLSGACEDVRQAYKKAGALITHTEAMARYAELKRLHELADGGHALSMGELSRCALAGEAGAINLDHFGAGWQFFSVAELHDAHGTPYLHAHHTGWTGHWRKDGTIRAFLPTGGFTTTEGNAADPEKPPSDNGDGVYGGRVRGLEKTKRLYHFGCPERLP